MKRDRLVDYSTRDYEGFRRDLIDLLKLKIPEYTDFSESDAGMVLIDLLAHGLDIVSFYNDIVAGEVFMSTAKSRRSIINLTSQMGYTLRNAKASRHLQVFEIEPQDTEYVLEKGFEVSTLGDDGEESVLFELEEDLVIPPNMTGLEKDISELYKYGGIVRHGTTIYEEVLGTSREVPDQTFRLGYKKALVDSIIVYVDEGTDWVVWNRVDSFLDSEAQSRDFMIRVDEFDDTTIIFGNDISGSIPPSFTNGIVATYRVGGGEVGNISVNTVTEMSQKPSEVVNTFNPYEAIEIGQEKESNHMAKLRATAQLRTLWRAVTIYDFEDLAYEFDFTLFSRAIQRDDDVTVDVYVLPVGSETLSSTEKKGLEDLYENRKLLGVKVAVNSPVYKTVDFEIHLKIFSNFTVKEVEGDVRTFLSNRLRLGKNDFGEEVNLSELIGDIVQIDGVRSVSFTAPLADVELADNEIARIGTITFETEGGIRG